MSQVTKSLLFCLLFLISFNSLAYTIEIKASDIVHVEKENLRNNEIELQLWLRSSDNEENNLIKMFFKDDKSFEENYIKDSQGNLKINDIGFTVILGNPVSVNNYELTNSFKIPNWFYILIVTLIFMILSFLFTVRKYLYKHEK